MRHAGNKLPRYYFALDRINREVPKLKNIWIYRSPYGFMPSWNRRELDKERGQWPAGQVGLFGLIELLVCIENCLKLDKDVFVVLLRARACPVSRGDARDARLSRRRPQASRPEGLRQEAAPARTGASSAAAMAWLAQSSLAGARGGAARCAARCASSTRSWSRVAALIVSEIARRSTIFSRAAPRCCRDALDRAFAACDNHAVTSFGRDYVQRNRTELAGMIKLAQGSKALAGFQRFGRL